MLPKQPKTVMQIRRSCSVKGCEDQSKFSKHSFFSFPEDKSLCNIWKEMTGRTNWSPSDVSYICQSHFTADCLSFVNGKVILAHGSVPTLKLPMHVMQVEYINEDMLDNDVPLYDETESEPDVPDSNTVQQSKRKDRTANLEMLKLFNEVQFKQRKIVAQSKRLRQDKRMLKLRNRVINTLREKIKEKEQQLRQREQGETRMNGKEESMEIDTEEAEILLMPTRYTRDSKNFALSIYNYSPEAYIYLRNTLRTVLPSTGILKKWLSEGFEAKNVMTDAECLKVATEVREHDLYCRVSIM